MKRIAAAILMLPLVGGFVITSGCAKKKTEPTMTAAASPQVMPKIGDICKLSDSGRHHGEYIFYKNLHALAEAFKHNNTKDDYGTREMIRDGKIFKVAVDRVRLIGLHQISDLVMAEVRILDGPAEGKIGWTIYEELILPGKE